MQKKILLKSLFVFTLMMVYLVSNSQIDCGKNALNSVQINYETGKFKDCITQVKYCTLNQGFNNDERVIAYRLLAMSYLAMDSIKEARNIIGRLLFFNDNFEPDTRDPERFKKELIEIKSLYNTNSVSSVSKRNEELRLAPATISVITRAEIIERGYNDIIDILKDVPGFDISIYYGVLYANVYQRGMRTNNTEKTLLLIDGVEDNNLWTNYADISQQYPLSNIKRVEIIYGPASTMYGANAFSGVINIITKEPEDFLKKNQKSAISAKIGIGNYATKNAEITYASKLKLLNFDITARVNMSDRPDLSSQTLFDYNPGVYDNINYANLLSIKSNAQSYLSTNKLPLVSPYYQVYGTVGAADSILLTQQGVILARNFDKNAYTKTVEGLPVNVFTNKTNSSYIHAKFSISNFSLGFVRWSKIEGLGTLYTDQLASTAGTNWSSTQQYVYLNYQKSINGHLTVYNSSTYKIHTINNESEITLVNNYARKKLELKDLINNVEPSWVTTHYFEQSSQFRNEVKLMYTWNKDLYLISGFEYRNSQLQGNYVTSLSALPQDSGSVANLTPGGNQFEVNDLGLYSQAGYRSANGLGVTFGLRLDNNKIRQLGGFGTELSPRLVLDYSNKTFVLKLIFSRGIMNASNFTKYSIAANRIPNPTLRTESINNFELSLDKKFSNNLSANIDFYYNPVQNVVGTVTLPGGILKNDNIGEFKIFGIQQNLNYFNKNFKATFNYTYILPKQTKSELGKVDNTVADIANNHFNLIVNYLYSKNLNINFRTNYVGVKKAGANTTVSGNPETFPAYMVSNVTIGVLTLLKNVNLNLGINNIFDKKYYSPGVRLADGFNNPSQILQTGRNFMVGINYDL
jgi:outer membrane receptor for ferrienterochelin and colicin